MKLFRFHNQQITQQGFTLIEMVMTIVLIAILATVVAPLMSGPFQNYEDSSRRSKLVTSADAALKLMVRDLQTALPNSVRVDDGGQTIEMLNIIEGGRYRETSISSDNTGLLANKFDDQFHILGDWQDYNSSDIRLVLFNLTALNLYQAASINNNTGVITSTSNNITVSSLHPSVCSGTCIEDDAINPAPKDLVSLSTPHKFTSVGLGSPRKRIYLTDGPTAYVCDGNNLRRFRFYNIANNQNDLDTPAEFIANGIAGTFQNSIALNQLVSCQFEYSPGTSLRTAMVKILLTIGDGTENITLSKQVFINNAP